MNTLSHLPCWERRPPGGLDSPGSAPYPGAQEGLGPDAGSPAWPSLVQELRVAVSVLWGWTPPSRRSPALRPR